MENTLHKRFTKPFVTKEQILSSVTVNKLSIVGYLHFDEDKKIGVIQLGKSEDGAWKIKGEYKIMNRDSGKVTFMLVGKAIKSDNGKLVSYVYVGTRKEHCKTVVIPDNEGVYDNDHRFGGTINFNSDIDDENLQTSVLFRGLINLQSNSQNPNQSMDWMNIPVEQQHTTNLSNNSPEQVRPFQVDTVETEINTESDEISQLLTLLKDRCKVSSKISEVHENYCDSETSYISEEHKLNLIICNLPQHKNEDTDVLVREFFLVDLDVKKSVLDGIEFKAVRTSYDFEYKPVIKVTFATQEQRHFIESQGYKLKGRKVLMRLDLPDELKILREKLKAQERKLVSQGNTVRYVENGYRPRLICLYDSGWKELG